MSPPVWRPRGRARHVVSSREKPPRAGGRRSGTGTCERYSKGRTNVQHVDVDAAFGHL